MSEKYVLAHTIHYNGTRYVAGTEAEQIGEVAGEFGDHVWRGGKGPGKVTGEGNPRAGTNLAAHTVPTPSALPTPGPAPTPEPDGERGGAPTTGADDNADGGQKKATTRGRGAN